MGSGFGVRVLGFGDRLGKMGAILVLVGFGWWIWGLRRLQGIEAFGFRAIGV